MENSGGVRETDRCVDSMMELGCLRAEVERLLVAGAYLAHAANKFRDIVLFKETEMYGKTESALITALMVWAQSASRHELGAASIAPQEDRHD